MTLLEKHRWEVTHIAIIAGVIITLALVMHVLGVSRGENPAVGSAAAALPKNFSSSSVVTAPSVPAAPSVQGSTQHGVATSQQSDPRTITVGPSDISNRYTLVSAERKSVSPKNDELIIRLHVESLVMENLVSPFGSDMLEITGPGLQPISPSAAFHLSIPSRNTRNQDIVFSIPQGMSLNDATLRIHYYKGATGRCRPTRELRSDAEHERPCEVNPWAMPRVPADLCCSALLRWRSMPEPSVRYTYRPAMACITLQTHNLLLWSKDQGAA